jgi:CDP-glucose 4,6-dehydratase
MSRSGRHPLPPGSDGWHERVVLVTGAAGFLGGAVVTDLLARGARVIGLDIAWDTRRAKSIADDVDALESDVRDADRVSGILREHRVDTVIHLAAQSLVDDALARPAETYSNNIQGTWSVLEACRANDRVRAIVVASSDKAYGDWAGRPYHERMALRPRHPYEVSKTAADLIAQSYAASYTLPVVITRCGNLYGGGDLHWSRIVPATIKSLVEGTRPMIRSDGSFVRDYLHVSDAARGVAALVEALRRRPGLAGQPFNFASGTRLTVLQLVGRIGALMDSDLEPVVLGEARAEIREQRVSAALARRELGWRADVELDDGLREAIAWYRAYLAST